MPGSTQQNLQSILYSSTSESIIVQVVDTGTMLYQFANLHVALVRDCLLANDVETINPACVLPPWRVANDDLSLWFNLSSQPTVGPAQWKSIRGPLGQVMDSC